MGIDSIAKRYFPALICGLLTLVAFFQARGIGALVAGQLPEAPSAAPPHATLPVGEKAPGRGLTALPILARNAFDSVTGPLDKPPPRRRSSPHRAGAECIGRRPSLSGR